MGSLIGKLGDLLTAEYKLLKEAKGQVLFLKAELESMHVFLKKISDTEQPDEQDKCWAKEVRELSYDIEDSISDFMLRVEHDSSNPRGFKGFMNRCMKLLTTMNIRHSIAKEFEGLKVRVIEVRERCMRYQQIDDITSRPNMRYKQIDNIASRSSITTIDCHLLAIYAETSGLVAIEGPRDQLIKLMDAEGSPGHQLKVISIVGFGGLGKTTLANEIYRKLEGKFQCRAFVSVSQKPNIRKLLRTMLSQVGFKAPMEINMETWDESELIAALRKFLLEQRYFIVIDDIWDASAWDIIRCALLENMNGSRILITTRIETVARACSTDHIECVYKMKPLSEKDSRSLFFKRIFGSEDASPAYLNKVSTEILKKCGGLPLAIITTSSLLASQPSKLKVQWEHLRDSMGSNIEMTPSMEGMREILNLSYMNLSHYLKTCMLYLGIYPEDYIIDKNELVRRWIAEGFICKACGTHPEDTAKSYFNELVNRSLIQPLNTDYNGEVISCKIHDMMLDLILHKAREENFITTIYDVQEMTGHNDKIRRLSLNLDNAIGDRVLGSIQLSQTRTLSIFGGSSYLPPFRLFKHLRVLRIEISLRSKPPLLLDLTGIQHLFQLRSLKITATCHHVVLPSKIEGLRYLETFELNARLKSYNGQSFSELPKDIVRLGGLLHLIIQKDVILPTGISSMKSLRTLHSFNLGNSPNNIKCMRELTNLTDLQVTCARGITDDKVMERGREVLRTCLENICNLKFLDIDFPPKEAYLDELSSIPASFCHLQRFHGRRLSRVPRWIGQLHNLYDLLLIVKQVAEEDVGVLAQLPSLIHLDLHIRGTPDDRIVISGTGFPVLKRFTVGCSRILYLAFEAGAMAKLETLQINFNAQGWDRHGAAPAGIRHLSGLKEISVDIGDAGATTSNRSAAVAALRNTIAMHPGRPAGNIEVHSYAWDFEDMKKDEYEVGEDDVSL